MVNGSRRDRDFHRDVSIDRFFWRAAGIHLDVVIAARLEICLETPRNILYAGVRIRSLQQIHNLSPQRLRAINGLPREDDAAEEILAPFMNWNDHINLAALFLKLVTRRIDYHVQKSFRHVKALHQVAALLHIGGHKRQLFLELRISLARRPHHVFEQFVRWLSRISVEDNGAQHESRTFGNVQANPVP